MFLVLVFAFGIFANSVSADESKPKRRSFNLCLTSLSASEAKMVLDEPLAQELARVGTPGYNLMGLRGLLMQRRLDSVPSGSRLPYVLPAEKNESSVLLKVRYALAEMVSQNPVALDLTVAVEHPSIIEMTQAMSLALQPYRGHRHLPGIDGMRWFVRNGVVVIERSLRDSQLYLAINISGTAYTYPLVQFGRQIASVVFSEGDAKRVRASDGDDELYLPPGAMMLVEQFSP